MILSSPKIGFQSFQKKALLGCFDSGSEVCWYLPTVTSTGLPFGTAKGHRALGYKGILLCKGTLGKKKFRTDMMKRNKLFLCSSLLTAF